jgi:hypothetical protein
MCEYGEILRIPTQAPNTHLLVIVYAMSEYEQIELVIMYFFDPDNSVE